jgi:hypothetical protein
MHDGTPCVLCGLKAAPTSKQGKILAMKVRIIFFCAVLFHAGTALSQLGANCGEHPGVLRNKSGIVWFTSEQLEKMAIKRIEPVMPSTPVGFHYDGYVSFKILVDKNGEISCIWGRAGNPTFVVAVNEALQYWTFKPMLVNGKPVEFVGVMKFHVYAN